MTILYGIEEQGTTGWNKLPEEYRHLTKQECMTKYKLMVEGGARPDDLRVVRDDL